MTGSKILPHRGPSTSYAHGHDEAAREYFQHSSAPRVSTDTVILEALRRQHAHLKVTVIPSTSCNLLDYAAAGHASAKPLSDDDKHEAATAGAGAGTVDVATTTASKTLASSSSTIHGGKPYDPVYGPPVKWRRYIPAGRRLDGRPGVLIDDVHFGTYVYRWQGHEFLLYVVDGRDGSSYYPVVVNNYLVSEPGPSGQAAVDSLILEAGRYGSELHNEVWVFDHGYWQKNAELWESVQHAEWENVILDPDMKKALRDDVDRFYDSRATYAKLKVPWKRGVIYYGPPGNGKTISIKAMMHTLYRREDPVPTLYVRSLSSYGGPEMALSDIFRKAREVAPCYLVFEDLDSIVDDRTRSYFLNEVDGLSANDGILMVGSTNHLDRLDPGISKRPSRFDRKYFFPNPNETERIAYARFWQHKLAENQEIAFPDSLCPALAGITDGFSFAYMQEAFVGALMALAVQDDDLVAAIASLSTTGGGDDLDKVPLWKELQKQVKILREEMDRN